MKFSFDRNTYASFFEEASYELESTLWVAINELSPAMETFEFVPEGELTQKQRICLTRYQAQLHCEGGDIVLLVPDELVPSNARARVELIYDEGYKTRKLVLTLMYT